MFPLLFKSIDVDSFYCDVCEFSKHRTIYAIKGVLFHLPSYIVIFGVHLEFQMYPKLDGLLPLLMIAQEYLGFFS